MESRRVIARESGRSGSPRRCCGVPDSRFRRNDTAQLVTISMLPFTGTRSLPSKQRFWQSSASYIQREQLATDIRPNLAGQQRIAR